MNKLKSDRSSERGSRNKILAVFVLLILAANAGYHYIPVAYEGASFRQEMDTAVVKGLAASGNMKPLDVVKAHVSRAASEYNVPQDAVIEIKPMPNYIQAYVSYQKRSTFCRSVSIATITILNIQRRRRAI